jgi:cell shape-determining protein MreD
MKSYTTSIVLIFSVLLAVMLQMTVFSRLMLLRGTADIVLLVLVAWNMQEDGPNMWPWTLLAGSLISFASALPFLMPIPGYLLVTAIARMTQRRIWQSPLLVMLLVTLVGTLVYHLLSLSALFLQGGSMEFGQAWGLVTLPSLLLNLLLALPMYAIVHSIRDQISPVHQQT